jgi:uncharacterized protein YecT (DUF1311 family)
MRLFLLLLFATTPALAQYKGPGVEVCRAYAKREIAREGTRAKDVIFEQDQELSLERYTRNVGSQFVSSILTGNGSVVIEGAPSAELSFVCLLADEKRAVFFEWMPRSNPSAFKQCSREAARTRECLQTLLQVAETDLTQSYAPHFLDARERDQGTGKEIFADAFRKANDEWKQYRDAECARRRDVTPQGVPVDDWQLACVVDLTRRRMLDMR